MRVPLLELHWHLLMYAFMLVREFDDLRVVLDCLTLVSCSPMKCVSLMLPYTLVASRLTSDSLFLGIKRLLVSSF